MRFHVLIARAAVWTLLFASLPATAQRVQFPTPGNSPQPLVPVNPNWNAGPGFSPPGAVLGGSIQPFDPYALPGNMPPAGAVPLMPQPVWPGAPLSPSSGIPPGGGVAPPSLAPAPGPPYGLPTTPYGTAAPNTNSPFATAPGTEPFAAQPTSSPPYQRLFQDTGLRATYLYGTDKDDLGLTEVEASTTAYFANFLGISNGLRVTPGFVFLWTDGPAPPSTVDVPPRLYSAYLDFGLQPQFGPRFGAEMTARVGVYSDFETFTSRSIRFLGTGVGVIRLNDQSALKLGVAYIDRVDLKLLPAFGVLWEPNPQTRWDIFFPAPKIANYWTTVGNKQVWWYVGGEYGGGSWTIDREEEPMEGISERMDINDIRIYAGLECWNLNRYYAFAEIGYVFNREIVFYRVPEDSMKVDDTVMVRGGISW